MEQHKGNEISHFLIIGIGTAINLLISLITTRTITKLVEPNDYGQYSVFIMYGNLFLMALCLGLDQSLVRFFYDKDTIRYKRSLLKISALFPILAASCLGAAFLLLAATGILPFEFSFPVSAILVIYTIGLIWNRISILLLRITYSSKHYSLCNIIQKCVFLGLAVFWILVIKKDMLFGLATAMTISVLFSALIATLMKREYWSFRDSDSLTDQRKSYITYGLPFILSMGLTSLFQAIDKMSLNHFCTYTEVGIYSSAMTIIHAFALIQTTFNSVWAPMQVEHYVKHPEDKTYIQKANQLITVVMFAFGIHLILGKDIIVLLLGEKYRSASYILPFLIFNPIMYTISETTNSGIGISKKSYLNVVVAFVSCVFNATGNLILVPRMGPQGAAISTGISYIVFFIMRTVLSNKYYHVDYRLWRLTILIAAVTVFAYHETVSRFSMTSVILYGICMAVLIALYYQYIIMGIRMISRFARQKLKKANG